MIVTSVKDRRRIARDIIWSYSIRGLSNDRLTEFFGMAVLGGINPTRGQLKEVLKLTQQGLLIVVKDQEALDCDTGEVMRAFLKRGLTKADVEDVLPKVGEKVKPVSEALAEGALGVTINAFFSIGYDGYDFAHGFGYFRDNRTVEDDEKDEAWTNVLAKMEARKAKGQNPLIPELFEVCGLPNSLLHLADGRAMGLHQFLCLDLKDYVAAGGDTVGWRSCIDNPWVERAIDCMRKSGNAEDFFLEQPGVKKAKDSIGLADSLKAIRSWASQRYGK